MRSRPILALLTAASIMACPHLARADYLADARVAMKQGDLKSAQIDLRNAVRADPQNAEAHYWLGRVTFELGDPVASEREATAARDRGFDVGQTLPLLAQALLAQNKFDQVLETLKPLGKDPLLDASILVSRGYALIGLQRQDDARAAFAQAEQVAPSAVEPKLADARLAIAKGDLPAAQSRIDQALTVQPKSAEALLAKAQLLRLSNETPAAIAILDGLIADQPTIMQARLDRAGLEIASGKGDAATADIEVVLKSTPNSVQAIYLQAIMHAQAKNYRSADADLERISAYLGRIQRAYYLQAVVKEQLDQIEQAEQAAQKYLLRVPNDLAGYKILARLQLARHRPDQVIDTLTKMSGAGKPDAEAYDLLGRAYAATGQGAEAILAFQQAKTIAPDDVGLQTRLAAVRMGMGDPDAAVVDLEHTLTIAPNLPAIGEALFFAALATGDASKAADALAKIRAAEGDTEVVANLEGLYKLSRIDLEGARNAFADVVTRHPDFMPAKINLARVSAMLGDNEQARKILGEILARQPTVEPELTMLVSSYVQAGQIPDAIALLERAHRADPAITRVTLSLGDLYIRSGDPRKAFDLAADTKGSAATPIEMLGLRAGADLALGQKKAAADAYAELLKRAPHVLAARRQLAALLIDAGEFEGARNVIREGISADPRNYTLYQDFALIDLKAGGVDAALATADRLQGQDRDFAAIRALKGDVYMAADRPLDAIAAFSQANLLAPSSLLLTRTVGAMLKAGKVDEAAKLLDDWIGTHPDDLAAIEQSADIGIATGRLDDAAKYLNMMLQQKPHNAVALNNLAWVYQQQGDEVRAMSLARQAYILLPRAQTADTLGWILTTSGNAGSGVALLRQANAEGASDPRILFHYAVALKDTGDLVAARKALEGVIATKGDFKEKTAARKMLDDLPKGT